MIDLSVVHYHLLPGGVTSVIRDGLLAILEHRPDLLRSIRLITGRPEGLDTLRCSLHKAAAKAGADTVVRSMVDPSLDYDTQGPNSPNEWIFTSNNGPDSIWWIHNHHLGKNLSFTQSLLNRATQGDLRVLLQIHDFPECGRIDGYEKVHAAVGPDLYPFGPNLRYAVINRRDYAVLAAAGVPHGYLHLLWNPVAPSPIEPPNKQLSALIPGGSRLWLYPVRNRRRKNVLEAGMLARMTGDAAVGVTLPPSSATEALYHSQVSTLFRDGTLPGRIGFGGQPRFHNCSLANIAAGSHAVISSSIEEGFGYQYLHAQQWNLPLIARDIETVDGFRDLLDTQSTVLYNHIWCPLPSHERKHLASLYHARLQRLRPFVPQSTLGDLTDQVAAVTGHPLVDYSYLNIDLQRTVAVRCKSAKQLHRHRIANTELLEQVRMLRPSYTPKEPTGLLEKRFGSASFASRVEKVLMWQQSNDNYGMADSSSVITHFAAVPYQRLLFDTM